MRSKHHSIGVGANCLVSAAIWQLWRGELRKYGAISLSNKIYFCCDRSRPQLHSCETNLFGRTMIADEWLAGKLVSSYIITLSAKDDFFGSKSVTVALRLWGFSNPTLKLRVLTSKNNILLSFRFRRWCLCRKLLTVHHPKFNWEKGFGKLVN